MMSRSFSLIFISLVSICQSSLARGPSLRHAEESYASAGSPRFGNGMHLSLTHSYANSPGSSHLSSDGAMTLQHRAKLHNHDRHRQRKLSTTTEGGADFVLQGNPSPTVAGLYWTTIGLGKPAQQFSVQVDTGSDLLWVQCEPCLNCATSSSILQNLAPPFNDSQSSNDNIIECSSSTCMDLQSTASGLGVGCGSNSKKCYYQLLYGDGSGSEGYVLRDELSFKALNGKASGAGINFGCGFNQSGNLFTGGQMVDGIMGLGMGLLSIPSQLANAQVTSQEFAQCLGGESVGGGALVFGSVDAHNASFTPLVTNSGRSLYFVNLQGLSVGPTRLKDITSASFGEASTGGGVIFDSGSTLAIVPDLVLTSLVTQLESSVSQLSVLSQSSQGQVCWQFGGRSVRDLGSFFPILTLHFEGADMVLHPENYIGLLPESNGDNAACVEWQGGGAIGNVAILGDIVLKNKLVIYDIANSRIGWEYMDCATGSIKTNNITTIVGFPTSSATTIVALHSGIVLVMSLVALVLLL